MQIKHKRNQAYIYVRFVYILSIRIEGSREYVDFAEKELSESRGVWFVV